MTRTKLIGAGLASVTLLSCASAPVVTAQDYKTGVFTICGGPDASKDALGQRAIKACVAGTALKVLRCTADVRYPTVGIEGEVTATGNCCDYACHSIEAPQPPSLPMQTSDSLQPLPSTPTRQ
jgi:hypothetical protein